MILFLPDSFAAEPPSETVDVVERAGPNPAATSASVTVLEPNATVSTTADVAELLDRAAGTHVERLGGLGDFSAVSIRGASLRQVEVFLDGVPLNPDGASVVNLSELPLQAFGRLEVWRGNAPAAFGASPIGGVVNLVTRAGAGGDLALTYGSWDTAKAHAYGAGEAGPWSGQLYLEGFHTRNDFVYFADNSTIYNTLDDHRLTRENNEKNQGAGFGKLRWVGGDWRFTLLDAPLHREEGLPGTANYPSLESSLTTSRNLAVLQAEGCGERTTLTASAWHLLRHETLYDPDGNLGASPNHERAELNTVGLRAVGTWVPAGWIVPSATLSGRWEEVDVQNLLEGDEPPARGRLAGTLALASDLRFFGERLTLSPVLALNGIDNRELGETADTQGATDPNDVPFVGSVDPRLGVLLRPTRWLSLKANGGRYLRPADLTELFGNNGSLQGNADLRPERGWQADVGVRAELSRSGLRGSADLTAFWLVSEDRIIWLQNSQRSLIPVNFGETWVQGVEAALEGSVADRLDLSTALTWQLSRNLTEGSSFANKELPRTPTLNLTQSLSVHWEERVRVGATYSYTAPHYWDAANLYLSAPRTLLSAFVRTQPTPKWPALELNMLNALDALTEVVPRNPADPTDESRMVSAITDFAGYPLPGRTLLLSARWAL